MSVAAWDLRNWTHDLVEAECRKPYRAYHRELRARHTAYYATRGEQRSLNMKRPFEARELAFAFPPGCEPRRVRRDPPSHAREAAVAAGWPTSALATRRNRLRRRGS